jgi:hypothetical protein
MKKITVKLSFLTILSGLYLAGLSANAGTVTTNLRACCSGGGASCCGTTCKIGPGGCSATN